MTSKKGLKKGFFNSKYCLLLGLVVFTIILFGGVKAVYALYSNYASNGILANKVGDFDFQEGTSGLVFYKQDIDGKYVRSYGVPSLIAYEFDDTLTKCTNTCVYSLTNEGDDCYYSFDSETNKFSITSNIETTCKLYFKELYDTDIVLSIMIEDENGTEEFEYAGETLRYSESRYVPAYGYELLTDDCKNNSEVVYDSTTNTFVVNSTAGDSCKVYFKEIDSSKIVTSILVQKSAGSSEYEEVTSIPSGYNYELSDDTVCYNMSGEEVDMNDLITYEEGYISIQSDLPQRCTIKLDIVN